MASFSTINVQPNEVIKQSDIQYGYATTIENVTKALQCIFETDKNFVIGGKIEARDGKQDMSFSIEPVFGICRNGSEFTSILETQKISNAETLEHGGPVARRDIIVLSTNDELKNEEQRAFIDFDTNSKKLQNIKTVIEKKLLVEVIKGDGETAPYTPSGKIKIAEILVPPYASTLDECEIFNITADNYNMVNESWSNEQDVTYNVGRISDVNERFRVKHEFDGNHKESSIGKKELILEGNDLNKVTAQNIQVGTQISVIDNPIKSTDKISVAISTLVQQIISLYEGNFEGGHNTFLSNINLKIDEENNVSIQFNDDKSLSFSINDSPVFTITETDIFAANNYSAKQNNSFITKSTTDSISTLLTSVSERVGVLEERFDGNEAYVNDLYGRFSFGRTVTVISLENQDLNGSQLIDGESVNVGDVVLLMGQSAPTENGLYEVQSGAWNRVTGYGNTSDTQETINANFNYKYFYATKGENKGILIYSKTIDPIIGDTNIDFSTSIFTTSSKNTIVLRNNDGKIEGDITGNAATSSLATTAENLKDTLPVSKGGTGLTEEQAAMNMFINSLSLGGDAPVDNDYFISQWVNGGDKTTTYHRRKVSSLWSYIQNKISSVLHLSTSGYTGTVSNATNANNLTCSSGSTCVIPTSQPSTLKEGAIWLA